MHGEGAGFAAIEQASDEIGRHTDEGFDSFRGIVVGLLEVRRNVIGGREPSEYSPGLQDLRLTVRVFQ
jgi:hypothetical protein